MNTLSIQLHNILDTRLYLHWLHNEPELNFHIYLENNFDYIISVRIEFGGIHHELYIQKKTYHITFKTPEHKTWFLLNL
jgi:hypothetical protein